MKPLTKCRISSSTNLIQLLDLGTMALTGIFPRTPHTKITTGPMTLMLCPESGLVQLGQSYDLSEMYGDNYGYRSGLNQSMVRHLQSIVQRAVELHPLDASSTVIDIGGNDGTLLKAYNVPGLRRICIDPTLAKWEQYYRGTDIETVADFFKGMAAKADIITSISMFYDLEDPHAFVENIRTTLKPDGIWVFEQSYLPSMIAARAFDTICQEHLEYYTLTVVIRLLIEHGLEVIDVTLNDTNGGSFCVTAAHRGSRMVEIGKITNLLYEEQKTDWADPASYMNFVAEITAAKQQLVAFIRDLRKQGKRVAAIGASTKGNVLLQWYGLTSEDIEFITDVNPHKWGCFTPGTGIPIVSESWASGQVVEYMLVLPWHFRDSIIEREQTFLNKGGCLIFPLPSFEICSHGQGTGDLRP